MFFIRMYQSMNHGRSPLSDLLSGITSMDVDVDGIDVIHWQSFMIPLETITTFLIPRDPPVLRCVKWAPKDSKCPVHAKLFSWLFPLYHSYGHMTGGSFSWTLSLRKSVARTVCSGSWSRFQDTGTYWNTGQSAYCPWPPWVTFLQITPKFHARVVAVCIEFHPCRLGLAAYSKEAVIGDKLLVVNDQQVCQWCQSYSLWCSQRHTLWICLTIWKN